MPKLKKIMRKSSKATEENLNAIEQQTSTQVTIQETIQVTNQANQESTNKLQEIVSSNESAPVEIDPVQTVSNEKLAPKKIGRKKKETIPKALEKTPDAVQNNNLRRSQRSKK
jgi:hypothetical protein